jgi:hypothetical protein
LPQTPNMSSIGAGFDVKQKYLHKSLTIVV